MNTANRHKSRNLRCPAVLAPVVFVVGLLAGCASLSVSHLESRPFPAATTTTLAMKFWSFEFTGRVSGTTYAIRGRATPVTTDLPPWVDRLETLTLTAYLRDGAGNVLASSERNYKGLPLTEGAAVPFEFKLAPTGDVPVGCAVSFGYKAVFGSGKARSALGASGPPPAGSVFFAGEGAVLKH